MKNKFYQAYYFLFATMLVAFAFNAKAQVANYIFSQSNGTYVPLTVGFDLGDATTNDQFFVDPNVPLGGTNVLGVGLPIGFNFTYNDTVYDKFGICANGWIILGSGSVDFSNANLNLPLSSSMRKVIAGAGRDLEAQTNASISFASLGTAPNRTLIVQWKNYTRFNNVANDSLNFQIRLNEADNSVTVIYGKMLTGSNQTNLTQAGIKGATALDVNMRTTTTSWSATTATTVNTAGCPLNANIFPPNGLTFNWLPPVPCTAPPTAGVASVAPSAACPALQVVSVLGSSTGTGTTLQWYVSADSINWSPVSGANATSYSVVQAATNYYRFVITCNNVSDSSNVVTVVGASSAATCYCISNLHSQPACNFGFLNDITISGTNFSNTASGCAGLNGNSFTSYLDTGSFTTTVFAGLSYNFNVTTSGGGTISMWIDYNQNGIFEATEWSQIAAAAVANTPNTLSVLIPANANIGKTGVRFRYRGGNGQNGAGDACLNFLSGETEDYLITIAQLAPCVAPPTAGTASASASAVCAGINYDLQLTGNSIGAGLTFQWQSSIDSVNWTDISGATNTFYSTFSLQDTYYRCYLVCSGLGDTSNVIKVVINPAALCYCNTGLQNNAACNPGTSINDVVFNGLSNLATGCASNTSQSYSVYAPTGSNTDTLETGVSYNISVTTVGAGSTVSVWIDYDQSGTFDPTEWTQVSAATVANVPSVALVSIPSTAFTGQTGMRIRTRQQGAANGDIDACTGFGSGETEDYIITLVPQPPCVAPPTAGLLQANDSTVCDAFSLSLIGATSGSGMTYVWESSTDSVTWTTILGATSSNYSATQTQSNYYRCILTCSGSSDTSSTVYVIQNSATNCYCVSNATNGTNGDIGNVTFGALVNGTATPVTNNPSAIRTYTDFSALTPVTFNQSTAYSFSVAQINSGNGFQAAVGAFIDYNQNGLFTDPNETVFTGNTTNNNNIATGNITIPATAALGTTRLRVVLAQAGAVGAANPCGTYQFGETEDYTINIDVFNGIANQAATSQAFQVFPNPSNGKAAVKYSVAEKSIVSIELYNLIGKRVASLLNETKVSGTYSNEFDFKELGVQPGIYFLKLNDGAENKTIRFVVY